MPPDAQRLERFLREAGSEQRVVSWRPLHGGRSADTVRIGLDGAQPLDCVLHVEPADGPLAGVSSARRQHELLQALAPTAIPAPGPLWFSDDPAVLGRPFIVVAFLPGDVPTPWRSDGRAAIAAAAAGGALAESFVRTLAEIHALPVASLPESAGAGDAGAARSHATRERERWAALVAESAFRDDPVLAYAERWLTTRTPATGAPALVHGDFRLGNLVLDGGRVTGVLDWELAEVGDPLFDLAMACAPPLRTNGLAAGLWEPEALVRRYEQLSGHTVDRDALAYYRVLATYKVASLWANGSRGDDLAALRAACSVLQLRTMLAETLDLPAAPAPSAEDPLIATVLAALREAPADETLIAVTAVLRTRRRRLAAGALEAFAADVAGLAARDGAAPRENAGAGDAAPHDRDAAAPLASPTARLAAAARRLDPDDPALRALVARAADPLLSPWPS